MTIIFTIVASLLAKIYEFDRISDRNFIHYSKIVIILIVIASLLANTL